MLFDTSSVTRSRASSRTLGGNRSASNDRRTSPSALRSGGTVSSNRQVVPSAEATRSCPISGSPPVRLPVPTHQGESEPPFGDRGRFDRPDPGNSVLENLGEGANTMIRRILAVIAIVIGVLAIFTSHAFGISALHLLAVGVIVLGVALVLAG